ncbi:MAG: NADH:ubiquinone reductase (Na(+)-transporting) subunit B [Salibacteraceae bacterium]
MSKFRPLFHKGGKYEKYNPLFESFDTLFFVPDATTTKGSHIRDGIDLKRTMITVVLAMIPALIFGIWNTGHLHYAAIGEFTAIGEGMLEKMLFGALKVLPIVIVSYSVGLGVEFIFGMKNGHSLQEGFLVSGMLIPLIVPVTTPLWMVAIATIFAVVIGKEVFGGTGMNIVNVALTARAFLFFAYPTKMSGDKVWIDTDGQATVDGFSGATALGDLASTVPLDKASDAAQSTMAMFNEGGAYSMYNSVMGFIPGSIGETSAIAIGIGALILLISGIGSWRIMFSSFIGGLVMAVLFNMWGANAFMDLDALHQLMLGGFMFGIVFMATDPVTAAQTVKGQWIYGFLVGFIAILVRVFNPAYPEGMMMAILFMNVMAPLVDHYVIEANISKRLKRTKLASSQS